MRCFVIMPFGSNDPERKRKFDQIYSAWIKPTVESVIIPGTESQTLTCHRADIEVRPGDIITNIIDHLVNSDIVIADLTEKNPNVFYELGVRHSVRNNSILISENIEDIPFDLRGLRTIAYQYDPEHMLLFKAALESALGKIVSEPEAIDNPVRRFLCDRAIEDLMQQSAPPGYDAVQSILSDMNNLKRDFRLHQEQVREVMQIITAHRTPKTPPESDHAANSFANFEGIWNSASGGMHCARVVDSQLFIPYCYSYDTHLTGHYYQCSTIDSTLFCRFRWFDESFSGYVFLKLVSPDKAIGGWWYTQHVPSSVRRDMSRMDFSLPWINKTTWIRDKSIKQFPKWAENYFKQQMYLMD